MTPIRSYAAMTQSASFDVMIFAVDSRCFGCWRHRSSFASGRTHDQAVSSQPSEEELHQAAHAVLNESLNFIEEHYGPVLALMPVPPAS